MKKLNKTGQSTNPWGFPLVTGLQLDSALLVMIDSFQTACHDTKLMALCYYNINAGHGAVRELLCA